MKYCCGNEIRLRRKASRISLKNSGLKVCVFIISLAAFLAGCSPTALQQTPQIDLSASVKPLVVQKDGAVWLLSGENAQQLGNYASLCTEPGDPHSLSVMVSESGWVYYVSGYDPHKGAGKLMMTHGDADTRPLNVSGNVSAACVSRDGQALFCKNVRDGAGELWLCAPGRKAQMVAQSVVPDMFSFSDDGSQFYYVKNIGKAYELNLVSGGDIRVLYQADPPEFRYFTAVFDGKGGLLFGFGRSLDEMSFYNDKDGKLTEGGGQPVGVFGAADDFLYNRMEQDSLYSGQQSYQLYYKAPGQDAEPISEKCCGIVFPGQSTGYFNIGDSKTFLLAELSGDAGTEDVNEYTITEDGTNIEQSVDAAMQELYLYMIGGEKTYIGQASLYSHLVLANGLNSVVAIQEDGLYLYHRTDGEWTASESLGTCLGFDWNDRYFYWLDQGYVLHQCDLDSGSTKALLDKALDFWLIDDEVYVCVDNESIGRLTDSGLETLLQEGGSVTTAAGGLYISTVYGDIFFCSKDGTEQKRMLSKAEAVRGRGRLRYGYLTDQTKAALELLTEDAEYYLNAADSDSAEILQEPHGTPEEDAALALSLWRGTMPDTAYNAAGYFYEAFSRMAEEGGSSVSISDEVMDLLMTATSFVDGDDEDF